MSDTIVIVGHPVRKCVEADFDGEKYMIKFDGFKSEEHNEDPFIWNEQFLYSFCHANVALSKKIVDKIPAKEAKKVKKAKENVYFVFVARKNNKSQIMEIDTVIKADEIIKWPGINNRKVKDIKNFFKTNINLKNETKQEKQIIGNIVKYHLPGIKEEEYEKKKIGNLIHHNKKTLHTCLGDAGKSFLPMVKSNEGYQPYTFNNADSKLILGLLKRGHQRAYYPIVEELLDGKRLSRYRKLCKKIIDEVIGKDETEEFKKITGSMLQEIHSDLRTKK